MVLAVCVCLQWNSELQTTEKLKSATHELDVQIKARVAAEDKNRQLQNDGDGLKAAIESIRKESEVASATVAAQTGQADNLAKNLSETQAQLKLWEDAIKVRDGKISELNVSLLATRKRLDEALSALKKAGAR